jgi:eukaryotic translation initiation factor 2C
VSGQKAPRQAKYPERPGYGTIGRSVTLYANYLPLTLPDKQLYRYHIAIAADSAGRAAPVGKKARHIVRLLLEEHFPQQKNSIASDFRSTLVSCVKLTEGKLDVRYKEHLDDDYPETPRVHQVTVQYTGEVNPADLLNYLTSTNAGAMLESKSEILAALNIIMGHHPKTDDQVVSAGANRHYSLRQDSMESFNLGGGLSVLRGFFVSVRAATARVLLNVQVKYLACYDEGPLGNLIQGYGNRNTYRLEKFLKSLRVRVTHITRKNSRGQPRPRIKPIYGLANRSDGGSSANPPKIARHGAGPSDVQFFLTEASPQPVAVPGAPEAKKGKKAPRAGPAEAGRYITVTDFFKKGQFTYIFTSFFFFFLC